MKAVYIYIYILYRKPKTKKKNWVIDEIVAPPLLVRLLERLLMIVPLQFLLELQPVLPPSLCSHCSARPGTKSTPSRIFAWGVCPFHVLYLAPSRHRSVRHLCSVHRDHFCVRFVCCRHHAAAGAGPWPTRCCLLLPPRPRRQQRPAAHALGRT